MARKRSKKVVSTVVKITKKVVEETVKDDVDMEDGEKQYKASEIVVVNRDAGDEVPVVVVHPTAKNKERETESSEETREEKPPEKKKKGKKTRKRRGSNVGVASGGYKRYVFRVLKQVHPGMRVSAQAMSVLEAMMCDMFERIAEEAAQLGKYTGKVTMSSMEIQDAVRLIIPGELGKHAISEGVKAVTTSETADTAPEMRSQSGQAPNSFKIIDLNPPCFPLLFFSTTNPIILNPSKRCPKDLDQLGCIALPTSVVLVVPVPVVVEKREWRSRRRVS